MTGRGLWRAPTRRLREVGGAERGFEEAMLHRI